VADVEARLTRPGFYEEDNITKAVVVNRSVIYDVIFQMKR
jgi:hypothetical protein